MYGVHNECNVYIKNYDKLYYTIEDAEITSPQDAEIFFNENMKGKRWRMHTNGIGKDLDGKRSGVCLSLTFKYFFNSEGKHDWYNSVLFPMKKDLIRMYAIHEFGYVFGISHEHLRSYLIDVDGYNYSGDQCIRYNKEGDPSSHGEEEFWYFDAYSIMNYCHPYIVGGISLVTHTSCADKATLIKLYGNDPDNYEQSECKPECMDDPLDDPLLKMTGQQLCTIEQRDKIINWVPEVESKLAFPLDENMEPIMDENNISYPGPGNIQEPIPNDPPEGGWYVNCHYGLNFKIEINPTDPKNIDLTVNSGVSKWNPTLPNMVITDIVKRSEQSTWSGYFNPTWHVNESPSTYTMPRGHADYNVEGNFNWTERHGYTGVCYYWGIPYPCSKTERLNSNWKTIELKYKEDGNNESHSCSVKVPEYIKPKNSSFLSYGPRMEINTIVPTIITPLLLN